MSGRKTKIDSAAKSRIMSSKSKRTGGKATEWSTRAQCTADMNQHTQSSYYRGNGRQGADDDGSWWCTIL